MRGVVNAQECGKIISCELRSEILRNVELTKMIYCGSFAMHKNFKVVVVTNWLHFNATMHSSDESYKLVTNVERNAICRCWLDIVITSTTIFKSCVN